jgi:hypothetical protein
MSGDYSKSYFQDLISSYNIFSPSSYFYVHIDDKRVRSPAKRAAQLVKAMLPFRTLVES